MAVKDITIADMGAAAALSATDLYPVTQGTSIAKAASHTQLVTLLKLNLPYVKAQSGVQVNHTGDVNETTLATISLAAGELGPNGSAIVTFILNGTSSANNKTFRVKLDGNTFHTSIMTTTSGIAAGRFHNRNSASSQVGATSSGVVTMSVNTALAKDITITGQLASAGETITLEAYKVDLMYGA